MAIQDQMKQKRFEEAERRLARFDAEKKTRESSVEETDRSESVKEEEEVADEKYDFMSQRQKELENMSPGMRAWYHGRQFSYPRFFKKTPKPYLERLEKKIEEYEAKKKSESMVQGGSGDFANTERHEAQMKKPKAEHVSRVEKRSEDEEDMKLFYDTNEGEEEEELQARNKDHDCEENKGRVGRMPPAVVGEEEISSERADGQVEMLSDCITVGLNASGGNEITYDEEEDDDSGGDHDDDDGDGDEDEGEVEVDEDGGVRMRMRTIAC
eukprot:756011-Hanusia_phi.AAC.3